MDTDKTATGTRMRSGMSRWVGLVLLLLLASTITPTRLTGQTAADWAEAAARGFDGRLTEGHFAVAWRLAEASEAEVRRFLAVAESSFERIALILGVEQTPTRPVMLILAGHAQADDGVWRAPSVDERGRVILLRYDDGVMSYAQELTHELVHAFRRHSGQWRSGFLEEGFAEVIAMEADPSDRGFPRYGYSLTVIAGDLIDRNEYLPLSVIRDRHELLNRRCQVQAYVERASFFAYLKDVAGLDAVIRFANRPVGSTADDYEAFFGRPFAELVRRWHTNLVATCRQIPDAAEIAERYRQEPAIVSLPICNP